MSELQTSRLIIPSNVIALQAGKLSATIKSSGNIDPADSPLPSTV